MKDPGQSWLQPIALDQTLLTEDQLKLSLEPAPGLTAGPCSLCLFQSSSAPPLLLVTSFLSEVIQEEQ